MREQKEKAAEKYGKKYTRIPMLVSVFLLLLTMGCGRGAGEEKNIPGSIQTDAGTGESTEAGNGTGAGGSAADTDLASESKIPNGADQAAGDAGTGTDAWTQEGFWTEKDGGAEDFDAEKVTDAEGELRVACLAHFGMEYVERMATQFCMENRRCSIAVERAEDDAEQEDFRDRIMVELAAGKGPELLWVFGEDMRILNDKGLLADLGPMLPEKTKSQIFPGVLQACTLDGKLVAVTPEISFSSMIVSNDIWERDAWTQTEFLDLLEQHRDSVEWPVTYFSNRLNYYSFLDMALLTDYSDFIDWEQGTCSFDSEEFRRILRACKEYGRPDNVMRNEDERLEMLKDGRSIAAIDTYSAGLWLFSSKMKMYGEDCHIVGFPTASGRNSPYLSCNGYLVVNESAGDQDAIRKFLSYLWNYENQFDSWLSVRRDVAWNKVIVNENTGAFGENLGSPQMPVFNPLETKPDGSTYQKEFIGLLESCVPEPVKPEAVRKILQEELPYYFEGSKSVEDVTRVIQNRVTLYLAERK